MSFIRCFNKQIPTTDNLLYKLLYDDVKCGVVFPALRVDEFDFYHGGGVLFKYNGTSFKRNPAYDSELKAKLKIEGKKEFSPISESTYIKSFGTNFIDNYDSFKYTNAKHFSNNGKSKERQYLEMLYKDTYRGEDFPDVCVLDIEVRFNEGGSGKKCDMVLFNSKTCEIMFVEGKIFGDSRMSCGEDDRTPDVVLQVNEYTNIINSCIQTMEVQYSNYISIMTKLIFGHELKKTPRLIQKVALLVYETPTEEEIDGKFEYRARKNLKKKVEDEGIPSLWIGKGEHECFSLAYIWSTLSKRP